jgi:hypothetical protein
MIKYLRQVHFYLGVFFAPSIIFFAFSGALQTFSLHENHNGLPGIPWVTALAELHKNQRIPATWTGNEAETAPAKATPPSKPITNTGTVKLETHDGDEAQTAGLKSKDEASDVRTQSATAKASPGPAPPKRHAKSIPLKVFVGFMGIGLIISSLLGIYMAFKYARGPVLIWGLLIAGTALPIALLYM